MQGASWEQAFGAAQHYGARITFITPATLNQVKEYTDKGMAVMIAWNPEGRPWSHASVIKDVDDEFVYVADPNIPDPDETIRKVPKAEFYGKWYEKSSDYLVRRCAMAVEREISPEGRQMVASVKVAKEVKVDPARNPYERERGTRNWGAGGHNTRDRDVSEGRSRKDKHKKDLSEKEAAMNVQASTARVAARYIQAYQYIFAQAFADQVGVPAHVSIPKLNGLILKAFTNALIEANQTMTNLKITQKGYIEMEYGPTRSYYEYRGGPKESPDERDTKELEVPEVMSGTVLFNLTVRELVVAFRQLNQFFNHHRNEIEAFFKDPKNLRLIEKYFNWILKTDTSILDEFELAYVDEDAMTTTYDEALDGGLTGGGRPTQTVTAVKVDFKVNIITVQVDVDFTYGLDSSDFELDEEWGQEDYEPDPDHGPGGMDSRDDWEPSDDY